MILPDSAPVLPSGLPLTNRHLTEREKANLAVVLQAYHDGEGASLDPQGFRDLFAADGVLNGIGGVIAQESLRGAQLSGLIVFLADFLPGIHRALKKITVSGDVVCIELTIQGTFLGPFQTPIGPIQPTGAKIAFPTADFWYLRDGKVEAFDCHIAFTTMFAQLGVPPDYVRSRQVTRASSCPAVAARRSRTSGSKKLQVRTVTYRFVCCNLRSTRYSSGHTPWSGIRGHHAWALATGEA